MAYARINKSGCVVRKGNVQLRLDFYLESEDPRYSDTKLKGKATPFHSHFIYLAPDFTDDDLKAQIAFHSPNFYKAFQDRWDEVKGGMRHGWATEKRIRPADYSKLESAAKYSARTVSCQARIDALTEFSYKPEGGIEGKEYPATAIDIGPGATDRGLTFNPFTLIDQANPANDTGTIDTFEVWAAATMDGTNKVGTFYGSGTEYTNRDGEAIGTVEAGAKRTFTGLDIDVTSGDFAGIYFSAGTIERDTAVTLQYKAGDQFGTGEQTYYTLANAAISIYGTGETAAATDYPISITCGLSAASSLSRVFASDRGISSALSLSPSVSRALAWARATSSNLKVSLAQLYEYYNTGDNYPHAAFGTDIWIAQTFTPLVTHTIASVKLKLYRDGSPGTINVGIKAVDGSGHPTGADLCSGTTNGNTLPTGSPYEWREITLGDGYELSADTQYAIVAKAPSGDGINLFQWRSHQDSPTYAGGCLEYTLNAGVDWTGYANVDMMFEEWGTGISRTADYSRASSSNLSATATISRALAWGRGITAGLTTAISVSVSGITNYLVTITANLSLAASLARGFATTRATSPGLTVAATIAKSWGRTISSSVGLTVGTSISRLAKWTRGTSSALSVVATVARSFARTITSSVSLTASATVSRLLAFTRSSTSNLALAASISKFRGWVISTSSSLGLTVTISRLVGFARAASSGLAVSVSVFTGTAAHYLVTIATNLSVGVSLARTWASARATSSSLSLSTSVSRAWGRTITTVANLSLTTTVSRLATWARSSSPGLTVAVSVLRSWARTVTTSTGLNLTASVSRAADWGRNTTSNLSLSVSLARSWGRTIVTSVGLTLATSVTRSVDWIRATTSNLDLSVSLVVGGITNYLIELTTNLSVTTTVMRSWAATRATSSALSVATSISRIMAWVVATTSNLNLAVTVDRITSYIRATSSSLTVSPTISRTLAYARGITSNLSLAVTINRATEYLVTITANLSVSAIIRVFPRIKSLIFRVMHTFTGRTIRDDYDAFRDIKDDHDQFRPVK